MSCQKVTNFQGRYTYSQEDKGDENVELMLEIRQDEEARVSAKIAIHHFMKQLFLYSDVAETSNAEISEDTLRLKFGLSADPLSLIDAEKEEREFSITLLRQENQPLYILSSTGDIVPSGTLRLDSVAAADTTFMIKMRKPQFVFLQESAFLYVFWGKVKNIKINDGHLNYYSFEYARHECCLTGASPE